MKLSEVGDADSEREQANLFSQGRTAGLASESLDVGDAYAHEDVVLHYGPAERFYADWPEPMCIIVDGPYGVGGFSGDPNTPDELEEWYRPHIKAWTEHATPQTTLWFWGTEVGWANVHSVFRQHYWRYRVCHIWNKGKAHIAGNANSKVLRQLPVVTEVCVQYVKEPRFEVDGESASMQQWLRYEWQRTGLPMYKANEACGVKDAATRKYLAADHVWYYPPPEMFEKMAQYANEHGDPDGRPYFSVNGEQPLTAEEWKKMRAKFDCPVGVNNVWEHPPVNGSERIKDHGGTKALHPNQKPLSLVERTIELSTDPGDVVWEPFGGLCTAAVAARKTNRRCVAAEVNADYFLAAAERLATSGRV